MHRCATCRAERATQSVPAKTLSKKRFLRPSCGADCFVASHSRATLHFLASYASSPSLRPLPSRSERVKGMFDRPLWCRRTEGRGKYRFVDVRTLKRCSPDGLHGLLLARSARGHLCSCTGETQSARQSAPAAAASRRSSLSLPPVWGLWLVLVFLAATNFKGDISLPSTQGSYLTKLMSLKRAHNRFL